MLGKLKKGKAGSDIPPTVEEASEGSPGYVRDYAVGSLRERRLLMSLRAVSMALFGSICICLVLAFLLVSLMPMKEVRPFLVQVSDTGDVVAAIRPIQDTFEAKDILTEKLVREYVTNRHEILRSTEVMTERWARDRYMGITTSRDEYTRFVNAMDGTLNAIREAGAERRVRILSANAVELGKLYVVDFSSRSFDRRGELVDSRIYTATIEIDFRPLKDLTREQMLINPTGFTVVAYSLAEKNQ